MATKGRIEPIVKVQQYQGQDRFEGKEPIETVGAYVAQRSTRQPAKSHGGHDENCHFQWERHESVSILVCVQVIALPLRLPNRLLPGLTNTGTEIHRTG